MSLWPFPFVCLLQSRIRTLLLKHHIKLGCSHANILQALSAPLISLGTFFLFPLFNAVFRRKKPRTDDSRYRRDTYNDPERRRDV